jgi:crossover junction endodeoxyribonuclease RusA
MILDDVIVTIALYFGDKRRRDIDNWHKILLDSLTGIVWKDDSQIQEMRVTKNIGKPRIELTVN